VTGAPPTGVRAVLFDAMGTLLALADPAPALAAALRARHGIEITPAQARAALAAEIAYYRAHHDDGRDEASLRELRLRCARVLGDALPAAAGRLEDDALLASLLAALRFRAFADAPVALAALRRRGVRVAVVSNWDVSLPGVLRDVGLLERLDAVLTSAQVGAAKPDPAIFTAALARVGVSAPQAVHVGDSLEQDVCGARASGLRAILLRRGGDGPDAPGVPVIASLAALPGLVDDSPSAAGRGPWTP
jgi:putative hydrolase of the HAD superfamily